MFLIVGLGNPGTKYKYTRHNLGFMVIDQLAILLRVSFRKEKLYWITKTTYKNFDIVLLKPTTYMNMSGKAVGLVIDKYKIDLSHLLIICDDMNLPFGKVRIRGKGTDGGHHGLASIIERLSTNEFARLRIGIGSDFEKEQAIDYVLSEFTNSELEKINESIHTASQVVLSFMMKGLTSTMNEYN